MIREKYKEKGKKIMKNLATSSLLLDSEDNCLLCHEVGRKNNQLVRMGIVSKGQCLASTFYGGNDKSKILFAACPHLIHLGCYMKAISSSNNYRCPLCHITQNCIFPIHYDPLDTYTNEICSSSIIISLHLHSQALNSDSFFLMLFKHLLTSKGLNNFPLVAIYHKKKITSQCLNKQI